MKQKLYLHIGLPKTGTTAIQQFLERNGNALKAHGILHIPHWVYENRSGFVPREKALRFIDEQIGGKYDLILSNEAISSIYAENPSELFLKERFPDLEVKIIVYLRRQDLHMESVVNFCRSHRKPFDVDDEQRQLLYSMSAFRKHVLENPHFYDYAAWLGPLSDIVGPENLCVRVFDRARFKDGDLIADFLDALGIPLSPEFKLDAKLSNESLDHRFTELFERLFTAFPDRPYFERAVALESFLALNKSMGLTKNRCLLSEADRLEILSRFEESNARVAERFFGESGPLFDMTIKNKATDAFGEGDLEKLPVVLNKIWYETVCNMDFATFNTFKLRYNQDLANRGDEAARKRYRRHKLINSIGRRLKDNFFAKKINFSVIPPKKD